MFKDDTDVHNTCIHVLHRTKVLVKVRKLEAIKLKIRQKKKSTVSNSIFLVHVILNVGLD